MRFLNLCSVCLSVGSGGGSRRLVVVLAVCIHRFRDFEIFIASPFASRFVSIFDTASQGRRGRTRQEPFKRPRPVKYYPCKGVEICLNARLAKAGSGPNFAVTKVEMNRSRHERGRRAMKSLEIGDDCKQAEPKLQPKDKGASVADCSDIHRGTEDF